MAYQSIQLDQELFVSDIYTIHYYEYRNDFHFDGERHDFWEFQCVDKGKAEIETDNGIYHLTSGQLIFHRPNEFHNLIAIGNTAPNIVVVSFECDSPCMKFFEKKLLKLSDSERNLMGMLIAETRRCIKPPLDDPYTEKMEKKEDFLFGSQQLIRIYLEQMLIYMIRRNSSPPMTVPVSQFVNLKNNSAVYKRVIAYMEDHIRENIDIFDFELTDTEMEQIRAMDQGESGRYFNLNYDLMGRAFVNPVREWDGEF